MQPLVSSFSLQRLRKSCFTMYSSKMLAQHVHVLFPIVSSFVLGKGKALLSQAKAKAKDQDMTPKMKGDLPSLVEVAVKPEAKRLLSKANELKLVDRNVPSKAYDV